NLQPVQVLRLEPAGMESAHCELGDDRRVADDVMPPPVAVLDRPGMFGAPAAANRCLEVAPQQLAAADHLEARDVRPIRGLADEEVLEHAAVQYLSLARAPQRHHLRFRTHRQAGLALPPS